MLTMAEAYGTAKLKGVLLVGTRTKTCSSLMNAILVHFNVSTCRRCHTDNEHPSRAPSSPVFFISYVQRVIW